MRNQTGYNNEPKEPPLDPKSKPREVRKIFPQLKLLADLLRGLWWLQLAKHVEHQYTGLDSFDGMEPVYKLHRYHSNALGSDDLPGAKPPSSPADFATTNRRMRLSVPDQPTAPVPQPLTQRGSPSPDSRYKPSWHPSAQVRRPLHLFALQISRRSSDECFVALRSTGRRVRATRARGDGSSRRKGRGCTARRRSTSHTSGNLRGPSGANPSAHLALCRCFWLL